MKKGLLSKIIDRVRSSPTGAGRPARPADARVASLREAIDAGEIDKAAEIERTLPADHSLTAEMLVLRGRLALARGDAKQAVAYFGEAIGREPALGASYYWSAVACMQLGMEPEALDHALAAERLQPGHPDMRTLIGVVRHHRNDIAGARAAFESALEVDPLDIVAHRSLAVICFQLQDWAGAERHFRQLVQAQPNSASALTAHASSLVALGREEEAWPLFSRALNLPGKSADTCRDYAVALFDAGRLDEARAQLDAGLRLDPDHAMMHVGRANCELIANGNSAAGWAEYEWRLKLDANRYGVRTRMWKGKGESRGRLLVYAEQGMGDVLLFSRYLAQLKERAGEITLQVPPALGRLMRASAARFGWGIAGWVESGARVEPAQSPYDREVPLLSLIHACGFPAERSRRSYLDVDESLKQSWAAMLGPRSEGRLRVGLVWAGNPTRREDGIRSILPEQLAPLWTLQQVEFVSLQMDCKPVYRSASFPTVVVDPTPDIRDFADTAAIMHNLDLVLSIDTAAAHLAGALGIPCWVLLSKVPDWRWRMGGLEQPWFGTHCSFAVERQRDWRPLMERVAERLRHESRESLGMLRCASGPPASEA